MTEPPYPEWHRNVDEMPSPPNPPHRIYDTVKIDGDSAPGGTDIWVVVDTWDENGNHLGLRTRNHFKTDGQLAGEDVPPGHYVVNMPEDCGYYEDADGSVAHIYINDEKVTEKAIEFGEIEEFNLSAGGRPEPEFKWVEDDEASKSTVFQEVEGEAVLAEVNISSEATVGKNTARVTVRNDGDKDTLRMIAEMDGSPVIDTESVVDAGKTWEIPFSFTMPEHDVDWRIRAFHKQKVTAVEKSRSWVLDPFKDYSVEIGPALDGKYFLANIEKMKEIIETDWTDKKEYIKTKYDCENFTFSFKAHVDRIHSLNQVGIVMDMGSGHAYNVIIFPDQSFRIFEPQKDELIKPEERDKDMYPFDEKAEVLI